MKLTPMPGYALVKVGSSYDNIKVPTKVYEAVSNGIVVALNKYDWDEDDNFGARLVNKRVFWTETNESPKIVRDNETYVFVELADIQGYESIE